MFNQKWQIDVLKSNFANAPIYFEPLAQLTRLKGYCDDNCG